VSVASVGGPAAGLVQAAWLVAVLRDVAIVVAVVVYAVVSF
jgi:hypothetical protein